MNPFLMAAAGGALLYTGYKYRHALPELAESLLSKLLGGRPIEPRRAASLEESPASDDRVLKMEIAMTVQAPLEELYRHWRQLRNLAPIFKHLVSVVELDANHSHWVAKGPLGSVVEWDAEIYEDQPNERIAWRSLPGSRVMTTGSVRFDPAPADRGSIVRVTVQYEPGGGKVGETVGSLLGMGVEAEIREGLRNFKRMMEAEELPTTAGQPRGGATTM